MVGKMLVAVSMERRGAVGGGIASGRRGASGISTMGQLFLAAAVAAKLHQFCTTSVYISSFLLVECVALSGFLSHRGE
jgi:hypothetical protein